MTELAKAISEIPALAVDVVEAGVRPKKNWVGCEIDNNVEFKTEYLETYCFAAFEPVVYDLMLLAAAVEFADKSKRRPAYLWQRDLTLRLPVHDLARWTNPKVANALQATLTLLTGDSWDVQFYARRKPVKIQGQSQLTLPANVNAVIPFSEGMDSRAVAGLMTRKLGDTLVRVRLGTKDYDGTTVSGHKHPFTKIPYKLRPSQKSFVESSARSRGFKFAVISGLAAYLAKASDIIVTESGQGALGPALVPVGQGYEDYRSHPVFTRRMEQLLEALLGHRAVFQFPRIWYTKAETLRAFVEECDDGRNWTKTWSCWQQNRHASVDHTKRHCGVCAACMLRRLSVHGAGFKEPKATYVWENLKAATFEEGAAADFPAERITGKLRQYAIAGTLHLDHLAGLRSSSTNAAPLNLSAYQLGNALGMSQQEARTKLDRLLGQHEVEWKAFVKSLGRSSFITDWALHAS